jgi:hypothetical protein
MRQITNTSEKKPNEATVTGLELTSAGIDHKSLLRVLPGMRSARFRLFLVLDNGGNSTVVPLDDFPSSPSSAARGVQLNRLPSRTGRIQVASTPPSPRLIGVLQDTPAQLGY